MDYIKIYKDDRVVDPNLVVREDGVQLRRSATPEWAGYEAFLATGGVPLDRLPPTKWAGLNATARARLAHAREDYGPGKPAGLEPPLPVPPPDPPAPPEPPPPRPGALLL